MSVAIINSNPDCLYDKCHKKLGPSVKARTCGSCKSRYHSHCAKNCFKLHRSQFYCHNCQFYCHDCLKQSDLIKYNPYFEVNSYDADDNEKKHISQTQLQPSLQKLYQS